MRSLLVAFALLTSPFVASAQSDWVHLGDDGRLAYKTTARGDRVPDFSMVGYHNGTATIPVLSVGAEVEPTTGDATSKIQAAIDKVAKFNPNAKGYRGAVMIPKGTYKISGTLYIRAGGIVLRGDGEGPDGTVLLATGSKQRSLIVIGPKSSGKQAPKNAFPDMAITDAYVPVGAMSVNVANASMLRPGMRVEIIRPSTANWIHAIKMDAIPQHEGRVTTEWAAGTKDIVSTRMIVAVTGTTVTLDAPVVCALDAQFGGGLLRVPVGDPTISEVGVENLRGDSEYKGSADENHGWIFVEFAKARDSWVRQVTSIHYGYGCVMIDRPSRQITVEHSACLDPVSQITGGRRYSFCIEGELNLVQYCYSRQARHDFVLLSTSSGPNVFLDCVGEESHADSGPHERWSVGVLFDNVRVSGAERDGGQINVRDRGNMGTGHGWAGADLVLWNCKADGMIVQNPPTAQNWAIGCITPDASGNGIWDSKGAHVFPESLYLAQLSERINAAAPTGASINQ